MQRSYVWLVHIPIIVFFSIPFFASNDVQAFPSSTSLFNWICCLTSPLRNVEFSFSKIIWFSIEISLDRREVLNPPVEKEEKNQYPLIYF